MGLIKTGLKTAVAVKTAHVVHNRIERRQQGEWASQAVPAGAVPAGAVAAGAVAAHPMPAPLAAPMATAPASAAPVPSAETAPDRSKMLDQLRQLGDLRSAGVLTDAEFEAQKALILGS
jgi:Short C-terminal domain